MSYQESRERIENHKRIISGLTEEIKKVNPKAQFNIREYCTELIYYTVCVNNGKIRTEKNVRSLYIKDDTTKLLNGKFLTEDDARAAIEKVLPAAIEKFKQSREHLLRLCAENRFNVGFNYDGDSHGIYNEYEYISFEMDGFSFQFNLED